MGMVDYLPKAPSRAMLLRGEIPAWIKNSPRGDYIRQVILSCPPWIKRQELQSLKKQAAEKTRETGEMHVLAHRVPLQHALVCGLTVPWNLEIKHWRVNASESNWFTPDQMELF